MLVMTSPPVLVLTVALCYDVTTSVSSNCGLVMSQVVDVQQHYVKPQPNELAETVLTEDCKLETGLDEDVVKQAPPLDVVLEEVSITSYVCYVTVCVWCRDVSCPTVHFTKSATLTPNGTNPGIFSDQIHYILAR